MFCASCPKTSNNKYSDCPALMSDGRQFTDYRPKCLVNADLMGANAMNTYEYRQHLIKNAEQFMRNNHENAYKLNYCGPCTNPYNQGNAVPESEMVQCNTNTCKITSVNPEGLGRGRNFMPLNSTEKYIFEDGFAELKQEEQNQIQSSACNTCSAPGPMLSSRPAVPGGAMM